MTATAERPVRPPRVRGLFPHVVAGTLAFIVAGYLGSVAQGVLWGIAAGIGLVAILRWAKFELDTTSQGLLVVTAAVSTVLATLVLPDLPESAGPYLSLRFAAAWLPLGAAAAFVVWRNGIRPSTAVSVGATWVVAAAVAIPAAATFGAMVPIDTLGPADEPSFGAGIYAFLAFVIGFVGVSATLAALAHLPMLAAIAGVSLFTAFSGAQVGFTIGGLIENITNIVNVPNFWPPNFEWAMGEDAERWWPFIWRYAIVWTAVGAVGYVLLRNRKLPTVARVGANAAWILAGALVLAIWLPSWEFGVTTGGNPLIETFRIAIVAATLGCGLGLPLAFLASKITAPNNPSYLGAKAFMNFIRTIPDLFWALIFVTSVGIGPFAGALALFFFSLAILAKLQSETIDAVDPGPLEAARATGSRHFPAIRSSVLPQVLPNYVAYSLYIFEINIRASVVLGLVGAGGIGRILEAQRSFFRFDRVLAIVAVIFVIVFVIEQLSVALRRRLV